MNKTGPSRARTQQQQQAAAAAEQQQQAAAGSSRQQQQQSSSSRQQQQQAATTAGSPATRSLLSPTRSPAARLLTAGHAHSVCPHASPTAKRLESKQSASLANLPTTVRTVPTSVLAPGLSTFERRFRVGSTPGPSRYAGQIAADGTMPCELEASLPTLNFEIGAASYSLEPEWCPLLPRHSSPCNQPRDPSLSTPHALPYFPSPCARAPRAGRTRGHAHPPPPLLEAASLRGSHSRSTASLSPFMQNSMPVGR